jgi:hypothetical protein
LCWIRPNRFQVQPNFRKSGSVSADGKNSFCLDGVGTTSRVAVEFAWGRNRRSPTKQTVRYPSGTACRNRHPTVSNLPNSRGDSPVKQFLDLIGRLFAVEANTASMAPEQRHQIRQERSKPVLAEIEALLLQHLHTALPQSAFGRALHYLHGQWPKLVRYVENGAWPISNNPCENAIRPFVVGRKNWLFCDTVGGVHASANLYSLIETCKANGVDVYRYLIALFKALPLARTAEDVEALLPWRLEIT